MSAYPYSPRPCKWWIVPPDSQNAGSQAIALEEVGQRDNSVLYAVRCRSFCLASDGKWEYEPMPSSRDDEFIARCRFNTREDALAAFRKAEPL